MRLVFMGTPDFAVPSFKALLDSDHTVVAAVTQPDRPKGRGRKLSASAVKEAALAAGVPVFQPESMKDPQFLSALKQLNADCFVVVAFRILPPAVYEMPERGTFNLHTSLLPRYRGAAPMQWALINGDTETGLTTFLLDRRVDTGAILLQERLPIGPEETLGELHDRMATLGAALVLKTVQGVCDRVLTPQPQVGETSSAPKIEAHHSDLDWSWSAEKIVNRVRGLSPTPAAKTIWHGKRLKIYRAGITSMDSTGNALPGTLLEVCPEGLVVQAGAGCVRITELQMEGRKRMNTDAFLRGCALQKGDTFDKRIANDRG